MEYAVFAEVCEALIARGCSINIDTGDSGGAWEFSPGGTQDLGALLDACFYVKDGNTHVHCDEWEGYVRIDGECVGSFYCVAGNDGWDLFADYSQYFSEIIDQVADKWEALCQGE